MNILPLLFIFITILSLTSYHFLHERISSENSLRSYRGYMRAERLARTHLANMQYKKATNSTSKKEKRVSHLNKEQKYLNPRSKTPASEASRFNLHLLFSSQPPPIIYETAARLIKILYGHADFFKESKIPYLEYAIIDQMKLNCRTKTPLTFFTLFPDDPTYQPIFYKLIKGTNHYSLQSKEGYPPLHDFFTLTPQNNKVSLQFPYASEALLQALWGEAIATTIIEKEKQKWEKDHRHHTLLETELTAILGKNPTAKLEMATLRPHLSFSAKRPKLEATKHTDTQTQITIRHSNLN